MSPQPLLPDVGNPLTAPFWAGLRQREIRIQRCRDCGLLRWPSAPLCPVCLAPSAEWVPGPTRGTLWSYVTYHRAFHPSFAVDVPYNVGLVDLTDGVRIPGRLRASRERLKIGLPVEAYFDDVTPEVTLLRWAQATN